jgi:hypothetical protein
MILNASTDDISVRSCNDLFVCLAKINDIAPNHLGNVSKRNLPWSSGTIRLNINGKRNDARDGMFYKWTGQGLTLIGSMKQWTDAVHALPARRRLLKKH